MTETTRLPDPRSRGLRARIYGGTLLFFVVGGSGLWIGIGARPFDQDDSGRFFALWMGLFLLSTAVLTVMREVDMLRYRANPPSMESVVLPSGELALFIPRNQVPSLLSGLAFCSWTVVLGVAGLHTVVSGGTWWGAGALSALALLAWVVAQPHHARQLAGGLWLTPTRVVSEHDGVRWEVPWDVVAGGFAAGSEFVLYTLRAHKLTVERTSWVWLRKPGPNTFRGAPVLNATYLSVSQAQLAEIFWRAFVDPDFRASLGSTTAPALP